MYCDLWPYVWLVFKSRFESRAGYSGTRTVGDLKIDVYQKMSNTKNEKGMGVSVVPPPSRFPDLPTALHFIVAFCWTHISLFIKSLPVL